MDGTYREMWIYVCTRFVPQKNDICGFEKTKPFIQAPMPRRPKHSAMDDTAPCIEHQYAVETFWYLFRQEEARMGREA